MARRKSIYDLTVQGNRLLKASRGNEARRTRIWNIRASYIRNISRRQGSLNLQDRNDFKRYSRRTYMGLNAG